jgi:hypothetical protein
LTVTIRNPNDHSRNTSLRASGEEGTMRSTVKHLRYVLGSLSAVLFSAASSLSV